MSPAWQADSLLLSQWECPCPVILFFRCSGCLLGQIRKVKDFIFSVFIPLMLLFSLCGSRFLTYIIFLLLEDFFSIFLQDRSA